MRCPECQGQEIKFFLRHQDTEDTPEGDTNANVITILCTGCGKNESYFLIDCLPDIFKNWDETASMAGLGNLFGAMMPSGDIEVEDSEPEIEDSLEEDITTQEEDVTTQEEE